MSNTDQSKPQQRQSPQSQSQAKARTSERPAERPAGRARAIGEPIADKQAAANRSHGLDLEEAIVTAGRAGELNITIEMFWVSVDGNMPAGFDVGTLPDHGLDVTVEQLWYLKSYAGTGSLKTGLTPIVPIGTKGRIVVTDTTTGETREQPWTWQRLGGGGMGLWQAIKRLLWKG